MNSARSIALRRFVSLAAALAVASAPAAEPTSAAPRVVFVAPDDPTAAEIRVVGERALAWAAGSIAAEAGSSIASHSLADALAICHLKGVPARGAPLPAHPRITALKRTSLKLRNPANAPDPAEQLALARVAAELAAGRPLPAVLVQRLGQPEAAPEWRVYRPVTVTARCAACHGPADGQSIDLRAALSRLYPADAAVGYAPGEWRGLVRVTVSPPPAPAR